MTDDLHTLLKDRLDRLEPPPGDLARARRAGTRIRLRRRAASGVAGLGAAAAVAGLVLAVAPGGDPAGDDHLAIDPLGQLDYSAGLRAYADPGAVVHLGGRSFPAERLDGLDVDGAATPYGLVYYAAGRPMLLGEDGHSRELEPGSERSRFTPGAKMDSQAPLVAYGATRDGRHLVVVRDLESGEQAGALDVSDRGSAVVDALDGGVVFIRDEAGVTTAWDTATGEELLVAGPGTKRTRVADVRNGVLLYAGEEPTGPGVAGYRLVEGAVDALLTLDGGHVLRWSRRLAPTDPDGRPVVLEQGTDRPEQGEAFYAIDTDGSVLVADLASGYPHDPRYVVYDCEVPSGACEEIGTLEPGGDDPMFIGVDMDT